MNDHAWQQDSRRFGPEHPIAAIPAVSFIVPVHRLGPFLADCLTSLLRQTYETIEIIVIDDAAPGDVAGVVASRCGDDPRVRLIRHEMHQGPLAAWLTGAAQAAGDFLCLINSDDWVEEQFAGSLLNAAQETAADLVQCATVVHRPDGAAETLNCSGASHRLRGSAIMTGLLAGNMLSGITNKLIRTECFRAAIRSLTAEERQIRSYEDLLCLFHVCACSGVYAHMADPLYHHVRRSNGATPDDVVSLRRFNALRQVYQALAPMLLAMPQPAHLKNRFIEREFISVARALGVAEPRDAFLQYAFRRGHDDQPGCSHISSHLQSSTSGTDSLRLCLLQTECGADSFDRNWGDLSDRLCQQAAIEGHSVVHAVASEDGIRLVTNTGDGIHASVQVPRHLMSVGPARAAYVAYEWLRAQHFDIICAPADNGLLFYVLTARHQNIGLRDSAVCAAVGQPRLLTRHLAKQPPLDVDDLAADEMERRTLALADATIFLDRSAEAWTEDNGWVVSGSRARVEPTGPSGEVAIWPALARLARERREVGAAPPLVASADQLPLVSVCIIHFNRPHLLRQAIESIRRQTYRRVEIVVVDDASTAPEAQAALEGLEAELRQHGDVLIRHSLNRYLGAARNTAARHAHGEFLLFLDDDDYGKPEQITTLVAVAGATGADIVNSFCDRFSGDQPPPVDKPPEERWLMLGNAPSVGVFDNLFGPAAALFRRDAFEKLGGFSEQHGVGCEDWEIFVRASLAGLNLQNVPAALFWYRFSPGSMSQTDNGYAGLSRALTPYLAEVPPSLRPVLQFAKGAKTRLLELQARVQQGAAELRQSDMVIAERDAAIAHRDLTLAQQAATIAQQAAATAQQEALATALRGEIVQRDAAIAHRAMEIAHRDAVIAHRDGEIADLRRFDARRADQLAAVESELSELQAALRIMLADHGPDPQFAVDAMLRSHSWRIGNLPRSLLRRLSGRRPGHAPQVASWTQAAAVVRTLQQSTSWELTGPLRVLGRLIRRR